MSDGRFTLYAKFIITYVWKIEKSRTFEAVLVGWNFVLFTAIKPLYNCKYNMKTHLSFFQNGDESTKIGNINIVTDEF